MVPNKIDLLPVLRPIADRVRQDCTWRKIGSKTYLQKNTPLNNSTLTEHLRGIIARGVAPIFPGESTTRIAVFDLDDHDQQVGWVGVHRVAKDLLKNLEAKNYKPIAFRSTGGNGIHIYLMWDTPQDGSSVRDFMKTELMALGFKVGADGIIHGEIEIFPKQPNVPIDGYGNQFILPLAGKSVWLDPMFDYDPTKKEDAINARWECSPNVPIIELPATSPNHRVENPDLDLAALCPMLDAITSDSGYDQWLKIGMAIHTAGKGSDEAFYIWDNWSAKAGNRYPGSDLLKKKWDTFRYDKDKLVTVNTIKKIAYQHGWHEDYAADFEDITEKEIPVPHDRFNIIAADRFAARPSVEWIIKGILPRGTLGVAYGASGDGKTFAVLDMMLKIVTGVDWNGRKVRKGKVIYVCAEGAGGFTTRLAAYAARYGIDLADLAGSFGVIPDTPNFRTDKDVIAVGKKIVAWGKADVVVIDTLAQVTTGADENTAKDMSVAIKNCGLLNGITGAMDLLIAHAGKDPTKGMRGWSGMKGAMDAMFEISRDGPLRKFWVEKMKDGRDGFGFDFKLGVISVGIDEDKDIIDSCFVNFVDALSNTVS